MALHRLVSITIGVPQVAPVAAYYEEFGLTPAASGRLATADGGEQLQLVPAPRRRLLELRIGADDADDVGRVAAALARLGIDAERTPDSVAAVEGGTDVRVVVQIAPRLAQAGVAAALNGPGDVRRANQRAAATLRDGPVRPRKLGHVVVGTTDLAGSQRFFVDGVGFKVSDTVKGLAAFLRCSTDHHNLLVQPAPFAFLHHTSWQVDDVDEIGRGAQALIEKDPARHVWGLGRHHIGSNYFWYLKDPAGNFSEYYADLDCIVDDELWTPVEFDGPKSLYSWGPPVPASFLAPDDLVEMMRQRHA